MARSFAVGPFQGFLCELVYLRDGSNRDIKKDVLFCIVLRPNSDGSVKMRLVPFLRHFCGRAGLSLHCSEAFHEPLV